LLYFQSGKRKPLGEKGGGGGVWERKEGKTSDLKFTGTERNLPKTNYTRGKKRGLQSEGKGGDQEPDKDGLSNCLNHESGKRNTKGTTGTLERSSKRKEKKTQKENREWPLGGRAEKVKVTLSKKDVSQSKGRDLHSRRKDV